MTNNSYFVLIVVVLIIVLKNIFKKSNKQRTETLQERSNEPELDAEKIDEHLIELPKTKNSWLYPTDEFGKIEDGVISDSKLYKRGNTKSKVEENNFVIHDMNDINETNS